MQSDLQTTSVADAMQERFGSDLRGMMFYTATGSVEFHHVRDEIDRDLTDDVREDRIREFVIDSLSTDTQERQFSLGSLDCTVRFFSESTVLNFTFDEEVGMVVGLSPERSAVDRELIDWCRSTLRTHR
jgi:hypothetical protein